MLVINVVLHVIWMHFYFLLKSKHFHSHYCSKVFCYHQVIIRSYTWNVLKLCMNVWNRIIERKDYTFYFKSTRLWMIIIMLNNVGKFLSLLTRINLIKMTSIIVVNRSSDKHITINIKPRNYQYIYLLLNFHIF